MLIRCAWAAALMLAVISAPACREVALSEPPEAREVSADPDSVVWVADTATARVIRLEALMVPPPDRWPSSETTVHDGCKRVQH